MRPTRNFKFSLVLMSLFLFAPLPSTAHEITLPPATQILGPAALFRSESGERLEIVTDLRGGIAIVRLPDGTSTILPQEIAGSTDRYRNENMTVWIRDDRIVVWLNGKVVFSGSTDK